MMPDDERMRWQARFQDGSPGALDSDRNGAGKV